MAIYAFLFVLAGAACASTREPPSDVPDQDAALPSDGPSSFDEADAERTADTGDAAARDSAVHADANAAVEPPEDRDETTDGGVIDSDAGPRFQTPAAACVQTGGAWQTICCHTVCGGYCGAACAELACACGSNQRFDETLGCVDDARCHP